MLISAINRMISLRKCTAACGVPPMARPKKIVWSPMPPSAPMGRRICRYARG
jgi:hypothetical protein